MQNPGASVICLEANCNIGPCQPSADNVPSHWVYVVIGRVSGASDDIKVMLGMTT